MRGVKGQGRCSVMLPSSPACPSPPGQKSKRRRAAKRTGEEGGGDPFLSFTSVSLFAAMTWCMPSICVNAVLLYNKYARAVYFCALRMIIAFLATNSPTLGLRLLLRRFLHVTMPTLQTSCGLPTLCLIADSFAVPGVHLIGSRTKRDTLIPLVSSPPWVMHLHLDFLQ